MGDAALRVQKVQCDQDIVKTNKDLIFSDLLQVPQREWDDRLCDEMYSRGICFAVNKLENRRMSNGFQFLAQQKYKSAIARLLLYLLFVIEGKSSLPVSHHASLLYLDCLWQELLLVVESKLGWVIDKRRDGPLAKERGSQCVDGSGQEWSSALDKGQLVSR